MLVPLLVVGQIVDLQHLALPHEGATQKCRERCLALVVDRRGEADLPGEEQAVLVDECHHADVRPEEPSSEARQSIHRRVGGVAQAGEGERVQPCGLVLGVAGGIGHLGRDDLTVLGRSAAWSGT